MLLAKFILSLKDDGGAKSCSVSHIPTLLGPQEFITFFTRKWEDGHLEFIQHQTRCAAVTVQASVLTLWRRNFLLNFCTLCI